MTLSFDEQVQAACVTAEFTEMVVTSDGTTEMERVYDAVGWACFGSVARALGGGV